MIEAIEKNEECNPEELYAWLDKIPSSTNRPKKNIPRDFSDAVLMAEVLKIYYPRHVDIHNYVPASSIQTKRDNWNMLNRKVLSKIDMKLSKDVINQLASSQQGVIEKVLTELRTKIVKDVINLQQECSHDLVNDRTESTENDEGRECNEMTVTQLKSSDALQAAVTASGTYFSMTRCIKNAIGIVVGWLISWICFWTWFFKSHRKEITCSISSSTDLGKKMKDASLEETIFDPETRLDCNYETNKTVPRLQYTQLKQELHEKNDTICILHHKIVYLEEAMKLKDQRIASLLSYTPNSVDTKIRPRAISVSQSKLRARPQQI